MSEQRHGYFGSFGGQFMPETLMNAVIELEEAYNKYKDDPDFVHELEELHKKYTGRPSLLYYADRMTKDLGGAKIYLKREDLNHTGSHKLNNVIGQMLLAKRMGKTRVIAETGAGQHGVATATIAALMGMECEVYMGAEDCERQALNVYRMELLGAKVHPVTTGTSTLKDAVSEALREWTNRMSDTHYVLGSVMGAHPFPMIVRDFQSIISREAREQILEAEGKLPTAVMACVGGGSNAMGMFYHFIPDEGVRLIGCEAAGRGIDTEEHAATIAKGSVGIFHGMKSYFCQDEDGQIAPVYSISAGLDYPGIGPEHAYLHDSGRAEYVPVTDDEAVDAFEYLSRLEGIIPAIESAHAVAHARKIAPTMSKDDIIIICLSGRGDKDVGLWRNTEGWIFMSKIKDAFIKGKAFIPFISAGDHGIENTERYIRIMVKAGADMVEIGIPFSDPTAEGPVIQEASTRALSTGVKINDIFDMMRRLRTGDDAVTIPLVFMTYLNPIYVFGREKFFTLCEEVGISGVIVPDMPFEEKGELASVAHKHDVEVVSLIAPTSENRIEMIAKDAEGFVYCVSSLGVTGMRSEIKTDIKSIVETIRKYTDIPVAVGFGISKPEQAEAMARVSDGAIVGSAIVKIVAEHGEHADQALFDYVQSMKQAVLKAGA